MRSYVIGKDHQASKVDAADAAWRLMAWLADGPLHAALREAVPEITGAAACGFWPAASLRLHRQVIRIRDAALALRPYRDRQVAGVATRAARAAGLGEGDLAAVVEASVLSAAMRARAAGPTTSGIVPR